MIRTRLIYRLILMFLVFACMIAVPMTFTVVSQVKKMIAEEEQLSPSETPEYAKKHEEFTSRLVEQIVPYIFYILVMALMFSIFFSRKMLLSLKELQRGSIAIKEGDLDMRLQVRGEDELAVVTRMFNEMSASLKEKTIELQKKDTYVNAMIDPLWIVDDMDRVTDINPAFTSFFGYGRDEILGASIYDFFDEKNAAVVRGQIRDKRRKGEASIYEVDVIARDGTHMPVLLSGAPILSGEGKSSGKIGIFKDFRQQKEMRSEIERSRDYVETVVNSIEDQLLVIDKEYRIVSANKIAIVGSGAHGSVVGEYCYAVSHNMKKPCWTEGLECPAQNVFISGRNFRATHKHVGPGGEPRYHEIAATPIRDAEGNVSQVIELIRDVTERIRREEEIFMKNRELLALNSIAGLLSKSLRADDIFANVLDKLIEMMKMEGGGIFILDDQKRDLACQYHRGISDDYVNMLGRIRFGEDIPGKVALTGQIMTTSDISKDHRIERSIIKHSGIKGYCCIPVRGKERIIGVFCLFSFRPHYFSVEEESIMIAIGEMTGIALENIRLYETMRDMYEQQRKRREDEHVQLLSLTASLGSSVDLRFIVGSVLGGVREIFHADFAWLLVKDNAENYVLRASSGSRDLEDRVIFHDGVSSLEGYAAEKRVPTVFPDIRSGSRYYIPNEILTSGYQSAISIPMHIGDKTVGIFTLYYQGSREFPDEDLHFLGIIANMLAVSLERYDHYVKSINEKGIAETVLHSVADGIVTVDTKGRIIAINRAFGRMTGISSEEAYGLPVCDALRFCGENVGFRLSLADCLEAALAGNMVSRDAVITTASGNRLSILISSAPVLSPDGSVTGVVNLLRDVSREKEIDRIKTEIVRSVSHEFRTPLSAIVGMTEMILDGDVDNDRITQYLHTILNEGRRLSNMVSDLLSIARIESGMEVIRPELLDMTEIVDEVLASLGTVIDSKQAVVTIDMGDVTPFSGDGAKLRQVLLNIVYNSLTFSDQGCRIEIKAHRKDSGMEISVKDNGWGISSEDIPHLRERFYRGRHGDRIKGTGLGLFLCNEILRLFGGSMDITSTPGAGTEVRIYIPEVVMV